MPAKNAIGNESTKKSVRDLFIPSLLTVCSDVVIGSDGSATLVRTIDQISSFHFPVNPPFWIVAELCVRPDITAEEVGKAGVTLKLVMQTPAGKTIDFMEAKQQPLPNNPDWTMSRLAVNASGVIAFQTLGHNRVQLLGKVGDDAYELLLERLVRVKQLTREEFIKQFGFEPEGAQAVVKALPKLPERRNKSQRE